MNGESTVGAALLQAADRLCLPILGRSSAGRPVQGGALPGTSASSANPGNAPTTHLAPLLVMAGIHGDEPASVEAVLELCGRWGSLPPLPRAVWLVPVLNPDGIVAGTKNSARDVDLNRNFPARNFSPAHKPGYNPGALPICEPETEMFVRLIEHIKPWGVVAVHAPFACINYDGPAQMWAEAVARASGWPAQADIGYPTPGSLGSWLGLDNGMPVLTIELPRGPLAGFRDPAFRALAAAIRYSPDQG